MSISAHIADLFLNRGKQTDLGVDLQLTLMERVCFEIEEKMSNQKIAKYMRDIADKIEQGESIRLESGTQKVELDTDRPAEFELKVEEEDGEESLELEIEWNKSSAGSRDLSVE